MVSAKHHEIRPYFTSTRGWKWWGLAFIQMFLILTAQTGFDWEPCNLSVLCVESTLTSCQSISPSLHLASKKWIPNNTLTGSNENCMLLGKLQFLKDFSIPRVRNPTAAGVAPRRARITNWINNRRTTLSRLKTSRVYRLCEARKKPNQGHCFLMKMIMNDMLKVWKLLLPFRMPLYDEYHGKTLMNMNFVITVLLVLRISSLHLSYIQVTATKGSNAETAPQRRKVESIASIGLALV